VKVLVKLIGVLRMMISKKVTSTFTVVFLLALSGVSCSNNTVKSVEKTKVKAVASSQAKDQALVLAAVNAMKEDSAEKSITEKKAWAVKRRKQHAEKKKLLLQAQQAKKAIKHKNYRKSKSPAVRKVAWKTNQRYELTGHFSGNSSTQSFIRKMSRSYGMDVYYLNRLFSQAKDLNLVYTPPKKNKGPVKRHGKTGSWTRYRNYFITPRHINGGVSFWKQHAATLNKAYQQYGVPPEYVVGILGVETIYGGNVGKMRVIDSLSTKAFHKGRRKKFFRNELEKFLLMARSEGLNPVSLMGSSAGAVGLCQFMPSNFPSLGLDFNRSGSCNLWDPVDAIGSVANYFSRHGWRKGGNVVARASIQGRAYKKLASGYKKKYSLSRLSRNGIRPQGKVDSTVRFLRMSTYAGDEVWLGSHNFYVITRYNHSSKYALAVHQLAQEVKRRYQSGGMTVASLMD